jgi:hypothetical protein
MSRVPSDPVGPTFLEVRLPARGLTTFGCLFRRPPRPRCPPPADTPCPCGEMLRAAEDVGCRRPVVASVIRQLVRDAFPASDVTADLDRFRVHLGRDQRRLMPEELTQVASSDRSWLGCNVMDEAPGVRNPASSATASRLCTGTKAPGGVRRCDRPTPRGTLWAY